VRALAAAAALAAEHIDRPLAKPADAVHRPNEILVNALPSWSTANGRRFLLSNADGVVIAAVPASDGVIGSRLIDLLGTTQPLTTFGAGAGVLEILIPDGARSLATVHNLNPPFGQVTVMQSLGDALAPWRSLTTLTVTLSA